MVVGFNHNVLYRGASFHIQTEDGGIDNPNIVTHIFLGGSVVSSKKLSYADIVRVENLDVVVSDLMKDQHKEMLRRLKDGEFDDRAFFNGVPEAAPGLP